MRNIAVSVRGVRLADTRDPKETIMPLFPASFRIKPASRPSNMALSPLWSPLSSLAP